VQRFISLHFGKTYSKNNNDTNGIINSTLLSGYIVFLTKHMTIIVDAGLLCFEQWHQQRTIAVTTMKQNPNNNSHNNSNNNNNTNTKPFEFTSNFDGRMRSCMQGFVGRSLLGCAACLLAGHDGLLIVPGAVKRPTDVRWRAISYNAQAFTYARGLQDVLHELHSGNIIGIQGTGAPQTKASLDGAAKCLTGKLDGFFTYHWPYGNGSTFLNKACGVMLCMRKDRFSPRAVQQIYSPPLNFKVEEAPSDFAGMVSAISQLWYFTCHQATQLHTMKNF
jgi:hypothetical protein